MAVFKKEARKPRHRMQYQTWMLLDGGFAKRRCTILNLSATGACISLTEDGEIGGSLSLLLTGDVRKVTRCRLIWRKESLIGVEFIERT